MKNSPGTKKLAVIGDPVAHSLSPLIHNAWIKSAGLDAQYEALRVAADSDATAEIRGLQNTFFGLNVTLPHKAAALAAASVVTPETRAIGAANTLVAVAGGKWKAHNTDTEGFHDSLVQTLQSESVSGAKVILIGAGGAARAAAYVLTHQGIDPVIVNRSQANAEALARELSPDATIAGLSELPHLSESADLVINSASLGHSGEALPELSEGRGRPFLDLSYGKAAARALGDASARGWTTHDGLVMLVGQAAAAFALWFRVRPDREAALAACRQAVAART